MWGAVPYFARKKLELPLDIVNLINVGKEGLEKIESSSDETDAPTDAPDKDFGFEGVNLRTDGVDFSDDEATDWINSIGGIYSSIKQEFYISVWGRDYGNQIYAISVQRFLQFSKRFHVTNTRKIGIKQFLRYLRTTFS